jgi:hypothetical protein
VSTPKRFQYEMRGKPVAGDPTISIFAESYLTQLGLPTKRRCLDARIEASNDALEDENGTILAFTRPRV